MLGRQRLAADIHHTCVDGPGSQPITKRIEGVLRAPGDDLDTAVGKIARAHRHAEGASPLMGGESKADALDAPAHVAPTAAIGHGLTAGGVWPP